MTSPHSRIGMRTRAQTSLLALLILASAFAVLAASTSKTLIRVELRSWIVAGRGRHLYLQVHAAPPHEHLSGRVEFTSVELRRDYDRGRDISGRPRLGRMSRGSVLQPMLGADPRDRLERAMHLSPATVECLQEDRVFASPYVLLTTNSNAAMRSVLESCGCAIPLRVADAGGPLGEFPGIDVPPGDELTRNEWPAFGVSPEADLTP